jgi:5-methylcytosine-specific restriction endonuclease McrA
LHVNGEEGPVHDESIEAFYVSWTWRRCRKAFAESKGNLCERCLKRGIIEPGSKERPLEVHHKKPLTADNVKDPAVALNWDNLELLCKKCHDEERQHATKKRWMIGEDGSVMLRTGPPMSKPMPKPAQGRG